MPFSIITTSDSIPSFIPGAKQDIEIAIFCVLYTYARQLNQDPYIHFSVTSGSPDIKDIV
ncbi:MAG: hypothetical protein ACTS73_04280 [Arsenophonus sp. NEOnobi-MAG3]